MLAQLNQHGAKALCIHFGYHLCLNTETVTALNANNYRPEIQLEMLNQDRSAQHFVGLYSVALPGIPDFEQGIPGGDVKMSPEPH